MLDDVFLKKTVGGGDNKMYYFTQSAGNDESRTCVPSVYNSRNRLTIILRPILFKNATLRAEDDESDRKKCLGIILLGCLQKGTFLLHHTHLYM